jgi:hypothetical protein
MGLLDVIVLQILNLVTLVAWWVAKLCLRGIRQIGARRD